MTIRNLIFLFVLFLVDPSPNNEPGSCLAQEAVTSPDSSHDSLKAATQGRFKMGVGVAERVLSDERCAALLGKQFQILTPENCMKPQSIHPAESQWNFAAADRFVDFAKTNGLEVVGHCLVWAKDDRTDTWMTTNADGQPVDAPLLLERIENHVATVVKRYQETATMWDVVNEALADGETGYLRESVYSKTTGIDFIETAFRTARQHDPDALLIYNDYNCHFPGKRKKLIRLLTELKQRGVPVDAYGMQGHFELGDDSLLQLRETFEALRQLEIKVVVSELDIDVVKRGRWWADDGAHREELNNYDPYKDGLPKEIEQQQLEQYTALFRLFLEYDDVIVRVSFWNLHDGQSWLNYFPWNRTNYPLLFDRQLKPKPAYHAVLNVLNDTTPDPAKVPPAHKPVERTDELSQAAHQALLKKAKQGTIDVYFQGDSITRRWGATDYPVLLAHWQESFHGWNAANFAWGGDNTHNMLWRMRNGELDGLQPKVVVLQAGANNFPYRGPASQTTVDDLLAGVTAMVDQFQRTNPQATIVLTALFPRDQNPELEPAIRQANTRLEELAEQRNIRFININAKLTDDAGHFLPGYSSDGLHLECPAYEVWAAALRPILEEILGPPATTDSAPDPTGIPRLNNSKEQP